VAYEFGREPLAPEHGGPARPLLPHLYLWQSAEWVRGLTLTVGDQPGFWEGYGYHKPGDPWLEQLPRRLSWHTAILVEAIEETHRAKTLIFDAPGWAGHRGAASTCGSPPRTATRPPAAAQPPPGPRTSASR